MEKQPFSEIKETEPRGKILFINMSTKGEPHLRIASAIFGKEIREGSDFEQMMLANIHTKKGSKPGSFEQIIDPETNLNLPESADDVLGVVITGSSFLVPMMIRDKEKFGLQSEGKGAFLPKWQKELVDFIKKCYEEKNQCLEFVMVQKSCRGSWWKSRENERGRYKDN